MVELEFELRYTWGFSGCSAGKESACNAGDLGSIPGLESSPGEGIGYPLQYSCLENPQGQRILLGYSPWGCKESDMTELLTLSLLFSFMHSTVYTVESESFKSCLSSWKEL